MAAAVASVPKISYATFQKVYFAMGRAIEVKVNPKASIPAYLIKLNFGAALDGEHNKLYKKSNYGSSAQLCSKHKADEITNQLMLAVLNFPRKQIGTMMSDCLVTGVQRDTVMQDEKRASTVFMTCSSEVDPGSRVGILGEEQVIQTNPRELSWGDFLKLDLRIGTISECTNCSKIADSLNRVMLKVNLGSVGEKVCVAVLNESVDSESLKGKQVLILTNLDDESKKTLFETTDFYGVVCTVNGMALVQPKIPVENGYKLA
jgi:tRNA-binding protein